MCNSRNSELFNGSIKIKVIEEEISFPKTYFSWLIVIIQKPILWFVSLVGHHLERKQVISYDSC